MIKINIILVVLATLVATIIGAFIMWQTGSFTGHQAHKTDISGTIKDDATLIHMHDHMIVTNERDFIEAMIPHHEEAVSSANLLLERGGTNESIRNLAQAIIEAQTAEIAQMMTWYERWYNEPYADKESYAPMMRPALSNLDGVAFDRAFLEDMIEHHRGAISMAQGIQPYITRTELQELTEAITTTQAEEITLMREILINLGS